MPPPSSHSVVTRTWLTCVGITVTIHGVTYLLNTLLPLHIVSLGGSLAQVGALFAATVTISMLLRPLVGGLIDAYGPRRVMLPGAAVLAVTGLALCLASTPAMFIVLMAGVGLSNALLSTGGSIVVAGESSPERRGEALALYYVASSVGVALGPPLGFGLRSLGGMTLNFIAVAVLAASVVGLVASLREPPPAAIAAPRPRPGLGTRHAGPAAAVLILTSFGHGPVYSLLPLHAEAQGLGNVAWFFPLMSGWTIGCRFLLRRASDRLGRARVLAPAIGALALGYGLLAATPTVGSLVASALALGAGTSMIYPTLLALVVDRTPEGERGVAIGTLSASWDLGVAIGSILTSLIVEATSYGPGFLTAAGAAALALATFALTERRRGRAP